MSTSENEPFGILLESGDNFKVYDITKDNQPQYRYLIYNSNGVIVKNETVWRFPSITLMRDNTFLSISIGAGTGVFSTQYYDIERDLFSEAFQTPLVAEHGMVVYVDIFERGFKFIVRDIFEKSKYYKEFELDLSPVTNPADAVSQIEFLDRDRLTITYLSGLEYVEKTSIFCLN
jgi:hypothetical protein